MLSIDQARKLEPELAYLSDEEVLEILNDQYGLARLSFEKWVKGKADSKNPDRLLPNS